MPIGTPYIPDTIADHVGGAISMKSPAQVVAKYTTSVKTPTKNFSLPYGGHLVQFTKGVPVVCDATLLAALAAINAPVV